MLLRIIWFELTSIVIFKKLSAVQFSVDNPFSEEFLSGGAAESISKNLDTGTLYNGNIERFFVTSSRLQWYNLLRHSLQEKIPSPEQADLRLPQPKIT